MFAPFVICSPQNNGNKMRPHIIIVCLVSLCSCLVSRGQVVAVKTNALLWATGSLNAEPEVKVGQRSTLALALSWNPFTMNGAEDVNLKWKLSEHMAGAGGIVGGLVAFSELFGYNPVGWLCIFILVAGMLGSARIILRHHTQGEVLGGFAVGLLCSLAALHPGSKLLIYLFSYILF